MSINRIIIRQFPQNVHDLDCLQCKPRRLTAAETHRHCQKPQQEATKAEEDYDSLVVGVFSPSFSFDCECSVNMHINSNFLLLCGACCFNCFLLFAVLCYRYEYFPIVFMLCRIMLLVACELPAFTLSSWRVAVLRMFFSARGFPGWEL